ncbi:MAG: FG-GAP-like repeat-containing protein [Gemmataceae bacterium]
MRRSTHRFAPQLLRLEARDVPAIFTVKNTGDAGAGSLRQAIIDANANPGADEIRFVLPGGTGTIHLQSALPDITDTLDIEGRQADSPDEQRIEIDGSKAGANVDGFVLRNHTGSHLDHLVINGFDGSGIHIVGGGEHSITGNFIGTDTTGNAAKPNRLDGVTIENSQHNTIGGFGSYIEYPLTDPVAIAFTTSPAWVGYGSFISDSNIISGNGRDGVRIIGGADNIVIGNSIGLSFDNNHALGNANDGVAILDGATGTRVGEIQPRFYPYGGVRSVTPDASSFNTTAHSVFPGYYYGYYGNQANHIGGNGGHGVFVDGASAVSKSLIAGNTIGGVGYDYVGDSTFSLANGLDGVFLGAGATDTTVNGNTISNNKGNGITVAGAQNSTLVLNYITENDGDGVRVEAGSANTQIGTDPIFIDYPVYYYPANIVSPPPGGGIPTRYPQSQGNDFYDNHGVEIRINGGTGTSLENNSFNGKSPELIRDPAAPGSDVPTITRAEIAIGASRVFGTVHGTAGHHFRVEAYSDNIWDTYHSRYSVGTVEVVADASGNAVFEIDGYGSSDGTKFTAIATDLTTNETSLFTDLVEPVKVGGTIKVNALSDWDGDGQTEGGPVRGVVVYLDANNNGKFDVGEQSSASYYWGDNYYQTPIFNVDRDGTFTIRAILPPGAHLSGPDSLTVTVRGGQTVDAGVFAVVPSKDVPLTAVGAGDNGWPLVTVFDANGKPLLSFEPFDHGFRGGVHIAFGDVDGDGQRDLIVAAGATGGPHVKIYNGADLLKGKTTLIHEFFAFDASFKGGVNVATADFNGDGRADIVVGAGASGGPHVRIFDGATNKIIGEFFAYAADFHGGVDVAAGDLDGDGKAEIITGAGPGGGPHVRVFDSLKGHERYGFFAFGADDHSGVNVAVGDIDHKGYGEIVVGRETGLSTLNVFDGRSGGLWRSWDAFQGVNIGVRVAVSDNYGQAILVVGAGPGGGSHLKFLDGNSFGERNEEFVFDLTFVGGIYVG